jgi:hypothetical protein
VTDLLKALLGNGSVNTFQHTRHAIAEVFSMWSAPRNSRGAVFSAWTVPRLYNASLFVALMSTESRTKRLEIELENWAEFRESAVEGIRMCQEDFKGAVVVH